MKKVIHIPHDHRLTSQILDGTNVLGALATRDVISSADPRFDGSRLQGFRLLTAQMYAWTVGGTDGEGPVLFGASAGYSAPEIEEHLESDPQGEIDPPAREQADRRGIWPLGILLTITKTGFEQRKPFLWKPNFSFPEGTGLSWWAYNLMAAALTTGMTVRTWGRGLGVWLRD